MVLAELSSDMIEKYLNNYFGNGGWSSKYWCIAIEPRPSVDGANITELSRTIQVWDALGRSNFNDAILYWKIYDRPNPLIEGGHDPIWRTFIKIILPHLDGPNNNPRVDQYIGDYRREKLFRDNLSTLIDLYPLPSENNDEWEYTGFAMEYNLPFLATRAAYELYLTANRFQQLSYRITTHKPEAIIVMGIGQRNVIQRILPYGTILGGLNNYMGQYNYCSTTIIHPTGETTRVLVIPQPGARGSNDFWSHISGLI